MAAHKILVVDDETSITTTLALILTNAGFQVSTANDGLSGLEAFDSLRPDLLLTDIVMPRLNGIELAIRARKIAPFCHILLFSGQAATGDLLREARAQGNDFELLHKPVHPQELLHRIRTLIRVSGSTTAALGRSASGITLIPERAV